MRRISTSAERRPAGHGDTPDSGTVQAAGATVVHTVASVAVFAVVRGGPPPLPPEFISPARADFLAGSHGHFIIRTANFNGRVTEYGVLPAGLAFHDGAFGTVVISVNCRPGHGLGRLGPVAAEAVVRCDPLFGEDRPSE